MGRPAAVDPSLPIAIAIAERLVEDDACWRWVGPVSTGYPRATIGGVRRSVAAVVAELALLGRPLAPGERVAHACPRRDCLRPDHLAVLVRPEPTYRAPRVGRLTCPRGHRRDGVDGTGHRFCCSCNREAARRSRERRAAGIASTR